MHKDRTPRTLSLLLAVMMTAQATRGELPIWGALLIATAAATITLFANVRQSDSGHPSTVSEKSR